jgi:hypothetical protein
MSSISCPTPSFCAAVDAAGTTLVLHDGTWESTQLAADPADAALDSVSCASATFCVALGSVGGTGGIWKGDHWRAIDNPGRSDFKVSVSCTSKSFCLAVYGGIGGHTKLFNGKSWTTLSKAKDQRGTSSHRFWVSCTNRSFCEAVGDSAHAWRFNGGRWVSQGQLMKPGPSGLGSVSCVSRTFCLAGGASGRLLRYDGHAWSAPLPVADVLIAGVSCSAPAHCAVVGGTKAALARTSHAFSAGPPVHATRGRSATLSTTLTDADTGKRLAGATVTLCGRAGFSGAFHVVKTLKTSAKGRASARLQLSTSHSYEWSYLGTGSHPAALSATQEIAVRR